MADRRPDYAVHSRETYAPFPELLAKLPHELAALSEGLCPACGGRLRPVDRDGESWLRCDACSRPVPGYATHELFWRADFRAETVYRWSPRR